MNKLAALALILLAEPSIAAVALSSSGAQTTPSNPIAVAVTVATNDLLIGSFTTDSSAATATPTYESPLVQDFTSTATVDGMRFYSGSGRASGSDTSLNFQTDSGGAFAPIGAIAAFSGVDTTTAMDASAVTDSNSSAATTTAGMSITTVTAGAMLVVTCAMDAAATTDPTFTVTDGGAGLSWSYVTAYEAGQYRKTVIAYAIKPSSGAITVTGNFGLSAGYGAVLYALRPAAGGGGGSTVVNPITGRGGAAAQPITR